MDRKEAAQLLGVSVRTLDRLVAGGRLTKRRSLRKTRPIVTFSREEVEKLRAELQFDARTSSELKGSLAPPKDTVAFRIDPFYLSRLQSEGQLIGLSAGEYARRLVIQVLEDDRVDEYRREVRLLREGLAATFFLLLTKKLGATPAEAQRLVAEAILKD